MTIKVKDILNVTEGNLIIGDTQKECENFLIDSRKINKRDTYVAIKGEHSDGNLFWKNAFENGADVVILNKIKLDEKDIEIYKKADKVIIQVEDTVKALGKIAELKRKLYGDKLTVIGVTGSVGKTSTKDIIANVISKKYKVLKTEGNNNNHLGLPLTILRLKDEEVAVIEMGMNHFGEISYLSKIAKPDIAVITNVGTSHIGNLGSRENILKAKLEIFDGMKNKEIFINNDNDLLHKWNTEKNQNIKTHTFGIENESDYQAINIKLKENASEFICKSKNENFEVNISEPGKHFVLNALCAIALGKRLGLNNEQICMGLKDFKLTSKRMEINHLNNNIIIINDSYNASFESMKSSILTLKNMTAKRKIAVLGDMFELGSFSEELHRKVGQEIAKNKIDKLYLIGENAKYIAEEAKNEGYDPNNIYYFKNKEELIDSLKKNLQPGDIALFKASNGMKLFEVVEEIKKEDFND